MKESVALIGSSLITCLLANRLANTHDVHVFESGCMGGAWAPVPFGDNKVPFANNLICPLTAEEERYLPEIYEELERLGCKLELKSEPLDLLTEYAPKTYILGDFTPAIVGVINRMTTVHSETINEVMLSKNSATINKKTFTHLIFPRNFSIKCINALGVNVELSETTTRSQHVRARYQRPIVSSRFRWANKVEYSYTENCDEVFDRAGIFKSIFFIGRVRRDLKHLDLKVLAKASSFLNQHKPNELQINSYTNSRLPDHAWMNLKDCAEGSAAYFLNSSQFVSAYANTLRICYLLQGE